MRHIYLFTSKDLQIRALFLQICMTVVLFYYFICCSSWFDASTHKHKSTLLSTAPVWMGCMAHDMAMTVSCCRAANVPLPRSGEFMEALLVLSLSLYTCIAAVCMIKAQRPTCEFCWFPELRLQELTMPTLPFHLCIWGNLTWGCRAFCNNIGLCLKIIWVTTILMF